MSVHYTGLTIMLIALLHAKTQDGLCAGYNYLDIRFPSDMISNVVSFSV